MVKLTTPLESMAQLIYTFRALHSSRQGSQIGAMQSFVSTFRDHRAQSRDHIQFGFNVFDLAGLGTNEVRHSALLAWLLDAMSGHGQGNKFLRAFLDTCHPQIPLAIPEEYEVRTEFSGVISRIDIVVYQPKSLLLYIENKTISPDTPDQHDREISDMRRMGSKLVPESAQFAIYLTPDGRPACGDHAHYWHRASYRDLGRTFENLLPQITEDKVRYILADWLETVLIFTETWRQSMTGFSDASVLIAENWDTVLDIMHARKRLDEELTELLFSIESDLARLDWWNQGWEFLTYKGEIYIRNKNWQGGEDEVLWLGIYDFDAEHIFGTELPPTFYVRTNREHGGLGQILIKKLKASGLEVVEDKWYFARQDIQKCVVESRAIREYPRVVREQIVGLFEQYANLLMQFDKTIKQYLKKLRTTA